MIKGKEKERKRETNYRTFFILGICFLPLGTVWLTIEFLRPLSFVYLGIGVTFLSIGLANRDKWEKKTN